MSTSPIEYPTLIAQLPYVSKLATHGQTHAEVHHEIFSPLLIKEQREKAKEQVPEVNEKQKTGEVDREGGGGSQAGFSARRDRRGEEEESERDDRTESSSSSSPWAGNIINRKI